MAGSGGPASRARCGAPHLFLWPPCLSALLGPLRAGVAPLSLAALAVPRCLGAVLWLFVSASRCLALRALAPRLCLPLGRWLLFGGFSPPPLPFLCLAVFVAPAWCLGVFLFFFSSSPFSPVRPGCLWLSLVSGPGCPGPRRFALFPLLAFRLSALRAPVPLSCFPPGWWLLPGGCCPPPPFCLAVFVAAARCSVPCAVPPWVRCCAALLRVVSSGVVLSCAVLCSLGAAACCAVPSGAARCPGALCSAALCFAVFPRAVCVLSWRGGACCCSLLCFVLCVSRGAVLCVPCPLRSVRCWCARVELFVRCVLLLAPGAVVCRGAVLGLVARGFLLVACFGVGVPVWPRGLFPLWFVWFAVVPCFPVSFSVVLCCRVVLCCCALLSCCGAVGACFALLWAVVLCCVVLLVGCAVFCPVVLSACCGARFLVLCVPCLLRSVRCGALLCWLWCPASLCRVLWRCAVVWCCAVVLCCRFAVLFVWAVGCGLSCCAVLCCWLAVLFFARWWCLRAVVLFSSCCAFPVFSALCAAVPCFPVLCPVVLCCRLVPWCPVLPPCWVCFLRGCGCTYLKNRCKIS